MGDFGHSPRRDVSDESNHKRFYRFWCERPVTQMDTEYIKINAELKRGRKVTQELLFLVTNYFYIGVIPLLTQLLFGRSN